MCKVLIDRTQMDANPNANRDASASFDGEAVDAGGVGGSRIPLLRRDQHFGQRERDVFHAGARGGIRVHARPGEARNAGGDFQRECGVQLRVHEIPERCTLLVGVGVEENLVDELRQRALPLPALLRGGVRAHDGLLAGENLQDHHAVGKHVGLDGHEPVLQILGRHVALRARDVAREQRTRSVGSRGFRHAEVGHFGAEMAVQEDVAGLHVLVDEARVCVVVDVFQAGGDVEGDAHSRYPRQKRCALRETVWTDGGLVAEAVVEGAVLGVLVDEKQVLRAADAQPHQLHQVAVMHLA